MPNQYDTELLLNNVLKHGDRSRLAEALRVTLSEISQQLNPNELRKSHFFETKRFLAGLKKVNRAAAQTLLCDLDFTVNGDVELDGRDLPDLTGAAAKETADLVVAQLNDKPVHVRRQECLEIIAAGYRYLSALNGEEIRRKGSQVAGKAKPAHPRYGNSSAGYETTRKASR